MSKQNTTETQALYRVFAELAFIIASADSIVEEEEKEAFYTIVEKEIGSDAKYIAKSRFDILDKHSSRDIEQSYNNIIHVIKQNASALDEDMIEKFMKVMEEVATVSGICEEEQSYIDRFRQDVLKIYFDNM